LASRKASHQRRFHARALQPTQGLTCHSEQIRHSNASKGLALCSLNIVTTTIDFCKNYTTKRGFLNQQYTVQRFKPKKSGPRIAIFSFVYRNADLQRRMRRIFLYRIISELWIFIYKKVYIGGIKYRPHHCRSE
jgi:hypothetical protein